jgi:hypothetical protein
MIVYVAGETALSFIPVLYAIALIVSVAPTATFPLYSVPAVSLGVLPSVVYRIDAPEVVDVIATDCTDVYVPATGLNVGVATTGRLIVYSAEATALSVIPVL